MDEMSVLEFVGKALYAGYGAALALLIMWAFEKLARHTMAPRLDEADRVVARMDAGQIPATAAARLAGQILMATAIRFAVMVIMATTFAVFL